MQLANKGRKGKAPQKNFPKKPSFTQRVNVGQGSNSQPKVVVQAARPKFGVLTSGEKEYFVEKADRRFIQAVERDVSITQCEAERLAEIAAVITDCSGTGQLKSVVHPNFSGDYATSNSDHEYFTPSWAPSNKSQTATSDLGMIVIGCNRGEDRVFYTSPIAPGLNTAEIDQVLSVPPGAVITVNGAEAFNIAVPSSATTAFMTGLLRSNNAPEIAILPAPNTASPNWAYVIDAALTMSGLAASGDLMNVRVKVSANTCTCVYRIWVRESVSGWLSGPWQLVEGDTIPLAYGGSTPWYNIAATTGPDPILETSTGFAIELCSTDGTEGYFTVELFPGASGGSDATYPNIIATGLAESTLVSAPISWWNTVASAMGYQLMLGAQEIITCTASQFNNQGTVVAGKLSKGANLSYSEPASDFFTTLSQMPRNNMTGALKQGASGFHIPDFTDRGAGAYDVTRDDVRYYVFRTTPVAGSPPPTMELKVYSNISYGVTSQIIPTFPVEPVPHVYALFAILSAINTMGTNEGHLKELFNQAKSLVGFILSPEGRKIIGEGIDVAKQVAKIVGPALATLV
jgi:hypothetical protein